MRPRYRLILPPRIRVAARLRYSAGIRAAKWSLALGAAFSLVKIAVGLAGDSRAALADGVESACDAANSLILLAGLGVSIRPPDADHPYGHERAESITAILLASVLVFAGIATALSVVVAGWSPPAPPAPWTIWPILFALPVKAGLAAWKSRLGERTDSTSLRSEGFNDAADVLSGVIAAAGILLARYGDGRWLMADRVAALLVAALILAGGIVLLRRGLSELMDEAPPAPILRTIRRIALGTPGVVRLDRCLGRRSGTGYYVDLHLEVDKRLPLDRAHEIGHRVKQRLLDALPSIRDVLTHIEPAKGR